MSGRRQSFNSVTQMPRPQIYITKGEVMENAALRVTRKHPTMLVWQLFRIIYTQRSAHAPMRLDKTAPHHIRVLITSTQEPHQFKVLFSYF